MNMQEALRDVSPGRTVYLSGPSSNRSWHVPRASHTLYGEIEAARLLIQLDEPLQEERLATRKEDSGERSMATTCVVVTSMIAEIAVKTLIGQTRPDQRPSSRGLGAERHSLVWLFQQELPPKYSIK